MTRDDLHSLLDAIEDTRELVLRDTRAGATDGPPAALRSALREERDAYAAWCAQPGVLRFAAYLAAGDQSQAALASVVADGVRA